MMKKNATPELSAKWWSSNEPDGLSSSKDLAKALGAYESASADLKKNGGEDEIDECLEALTEIESAAQKLQGEAEKLVKSPPKKTTSTAEDSPNTNAFVERFIQSIGQECLDRFVIFGEQHMNHVCQEYLAHYPEDRPHQSLENEPIATPKKRGRPRIRRGNVEREIVPLTDLPCKQRLGGMLKSYSRRAA